MRSLIAIAGRDFTGDFSKLVGNPELLGQALDYVKDPQVFKGLVEQEADKQATAVPCGNLNSYKTVLWLWASPLVKCFCAPPQQFDGKCWQFYQWAYGVGECPSNFNKRHHQNHCCPYGF